MVFLMYECDGGCGATGRSPKDLLNAVPDNWKNFVLQNNTTNVCSVKCGMVVAERLIRRLFGEEG